MDIIRRSQRGSQRIGEIVATQVSMTAVCVAISIDMWADVATGDGSPVLAAIALAMALLSAGLAVWTARQRIYINRDLASIEASETVIGPQARLSAGIQVEGDEDAVRAFIRDHRRTQLGEELKSRFPHLAP